MLFAEIPAGAWAAIAAAITIAGGVFTGAFAFRGNVDSIRAEANDELIKNLRQDNADLREDVSRLEEGRRRDRRRFEHAREVAEKRGRELFGDHRPDLWRYVPPPEE